MGLFRKIFFAAVILGFAVLAPMLAPTLAGFLGVSTAIGAAIAGTVGSIIGAMVARGLDKLLFGSTGTKQEAAKQTVRIPEPPRWIAGGRCRIGGGALFGEFDNSGNFWMVLVHCDSILTDTIQYYFDDIPITLDGSGNVTTNDFCLNTKGNPYEGSGTRVPYFQIWTTTYSEGNPTPPAITALASAFPSQWTSDHKLVGTTFSVVRCKAIKDEWRSKIYRWSGPFRLGEPALSLVGDWSNVYDPRDETQTLGNRSTYKPSRNAALIWAWWRTHPYGRRKPESSINWSRVAEQADICDQSVTGIEGTQPRYTCDIAIADDRDRGEVEESILKSFDAQIMFDETGKTWPRAGYYYAPTVSLNRYRDIMKMETMETQNGESDTQGVIVRYTDPDSDWSVQPSAPWINNDHYVEGEPIDYLTVDIPEIANHNQAMRVAKAMGKRFQALRKVGPTTGLRTLKALQERIIDLSYDNVFSGDYEIVSPIEIDQGGMFCSFAAVEVDVNRWTLLEGEESSKPALIGSVGTVTLPDVQDVEAVFLGDKILVTYTPDGNGNVPEFQYREEGTTPWTPMSVDDTEASAWSGPVFAGVGYEIQYRNTSPGGAETAWSDPPLTVNTGTYATAPADASEVILSSWNSVISLRTNPIARALAYEWSIFASDGTTLKRVITTAVPSVTYTLAQATADGAARSYKVSVRGTNNIGDGVDSAQLSISKAAPTAVTGISATDGDYSTTITFTPNTSASANIIFYSDTTGFDPETQGRALTIGNTGSYIMDNFVADTYYFIIAPVDGWSTLPDLLNLSAEYDFTINIGGGGTGGSGGGWVGSGDFDINEN